MQVCGVAGRTHVTIRLSRCMEGKCSSLKQGIVLLQTISQMRLQQVSWAIA